MSTELKDIVYDYIRLEENLPLTTVKNAQFVNSGPVTFDGQEIEGSF